MEQLKAKLKKQGGFTMVELLIVVAIIAILVAVSIPMMNQALEKSRHAVDQANVRDAVGLALTEYVISREDAYGQYAYCVDPDTHQGYLSDKVAAGSPAPTGGVKPACKCNGDMNDELVVTIAAPSTNPKIPTVTTSWKNNGNGATTTGGGTGGTGGTGG